MAYFLLNEKSDPHDLTTKGVSREPLRGVDCVYQSYALKYLPSSACEEQRYYAHPDMEFPTKVVIIKIVFVMYITRVHKGRSGDEV
jgi:hypothetical protein